MGRKSRKRKRSSDDSTQSESDSSEDRHKQRRRKRRKKDRSRHKSRRHSHHSGSSRASKSRQHIEELNRSPAESSAATVFSSQPSAVTPSQLTAGTLSQPPAVSPSQLPAVTPSRDAVREEVERELTTSTAVSSVSTLATTNADLSSNVLVTAFKELIQSMKTTDGGTERYPILNVIPEFDPAKRNQTIDMWISKVNECAKIYNWTDRQTNHYALPKLTGLAQKWYQGLPSLLFTWTEWQSKLKLAFPSDENFGQLLTDMLGCKAKYGESLEEYFYQKIVLLNRCNIFGKNAIDCILFGIEDRSVRTSAEAAQFSEPDKLLIFLRNVRITKKPDSFNTPTQPSKSENRNSRNYNRTNDTRLPKSDNKFTKCFNCGEEGHTYFKCRQPIKRCDTCHKVGHVTESCPNKANSASNSKTVLRISKDPDSDSKYFKTATVNGQNLDCFIDFGSQCTLLRESAAKNLVDSLSVSELPVLRGFGDSVVNCLGKCNVEIDVDLAKATVEAFIVPDHLLQVPLLLGQTFTEQDHVVVLKTNDQLKITVNSAKSIKLYVSNTVTVNEYTEIDVYTKPTYTGAVFIESSMCQNIQRPYEVLQSVVQITEGLGKIVVKGPSGSGVELSKDILILRALPLNEVQSLKINRIERCPNNTTVSQIEDSMIHVDSDIGSEHAVKLTKLLNDYRDCFAFSAKELGCVTNTEMNIKLNDTTPVVYRPYRLSHSERKVVRDMVQELEDSGIVKESSSDYASPVILVRKKTGDYRLCVDFRALNKKTVKEHYPLPRIDDQLDSLSGHKYYTSLDLASGYYQIPMAETSKHLTAFVTPDGHYEFNRMPFGLVNAPSAFQRAVNSILGNARFKEAYAYMDDVIIPSKTIEEGLEKLEGILELFRNCGITLNLSKCYFLKTSIDYLGFEVSEAGIKPGSKKIEAVNNFPRPVDQHNVRQFIGLASFFRRFIKGFSIIAKPLTKLLKKNCQWQWGDAEESAFSTLKAELIKRPILSFYNPEYETQVHTDASKVGIAGIIMQRPNKDSPFSAVAFYSRQTSPEETKFTSYDLETLAVVCSLQRFRVYLIGIPFTIVTDCNSLRATFEKRDTITRVARWWNIMQEFDFNIIYKPGTSMSHVDALSRNPIPLEITELQVRQIDTNWVATVQQNDPELQRIISILDDKENDNVIEIKNNFLVKRGLLYRKTESGDRWVVPKGVRWQVLRAHHDDIGHFGFDKTYESIKNNYWFAKMRRFIKKYVMSCLECAHAKVPAGKKAGKLHPIEKVECPFHTLHIDHLGPFVRSKRKNAYLLIIIDAYTKFAIIVPVKSTKAIHSIKAMRNYFHTFSVPKRVVSDRGTSFTAKSFQSYLGSLGIKHVKNAVATPRANGQVERYNRTVLASLTATNHGKPENAWDDCVSEIQWGLNNTINKGTGKSPAQALFGLNLVGTPGSLLQLSVSENTETHSLEETRKEITEHIRENQEKQKERFDKDKKEVRYVVGQLVRVEREVPSIGKSRKLVPKIRGPYRIVEVLNNDRYVIEDTPLSQKGSKKFSGIFSVDKIHPWMVFNRADSESDTSSNEEDTSLVELES